MAQVEQREWTCPKRNFPLGGIEAEAQVPGLLLHLPCGPCAGLILPSVMNLLDLLLVQGAS